MDTYILLLRGINVGGKNLIPMKELKSLLLKQGFQNVTTYIQSGNVVFSSNSAPKDLKRSIGDAFGFEPELMLLKREEFEKIVSLCPFSSDDGKSIHFYICAETPRLNQDKLASYIANDEEYQVIDKVFYLHAPSGIGRSKLVANIERCLGVKSTGRNLNTMLKLQGLLQVLLQDK
ncbi:DUF1697 domain-containing protein [Paraneptunicella aestuarii]|uniref:DUF1697 domain-containing protein n=1 Tax=Paraneptunicella aestuarii TaxID=2831148 RepID=UPI001E3E4ADC|nr:DUF1697 domain-containing protein [Paraneptunicella aestuarii]UAA39252.1 DUF1697 domain-containing protein [Paraneptunicella aestuarii]